MAAPVTHGALSVPLDAPLRTFDLRGPRGFVDRAKAQELLAPVLSGADRSFQRLILSTWSWSVEAAELAAEAIALLPDLRSLVLADIIAGRPEADGLAAYRALGRTVAALPVTEVDLSDNAMGSKGVIACVGMLAEQASLQRLFFCNCGISAEAGRAIADLMLFRVPTELRVLHLHNNMSGGGGAIAIADIVSASPQLRDLRFSSARATRDGGVALAYALRACPQLERLNLHDNLFTVPTGVALGATLPGLRCLRVLDVGDILLRDDGVAGLVKGLVRGCAASLEELDVSENEITAKGARAIARAVRRLTRLRLLKADGNELEEEGAAAIARAIGKRDAFRAKAGGDASPAAEPLREVVLGANQLGNRGALAVASALAACAPNLARLDLSDNELTESGLARIRGALAAGKLDAGAVLAGEYGDVEEDDEEEEEEEAARARKKMPEPFLQGISIAADEPESDEEEGAPRAAGGGGVAAAGGGGAGGAAAGATDFHTRERLEADVAEIVASMGTKLSV